MADFIYTDDIAEIEYGIDAQIAGEELDRIRIEHRGLTPAAVVDESRPDEAPLHPVFEWDDETAAEKYREHQATNLIRRVRVVAAPSPRPQRDTVHLEQESIPDELPVDAYDPLAFELRESVGAVIQAKRLVETLRQKAIQRFDAQKRIAANVALNDLRDAEQDLADAHEALAAARQQSSWRRVEHHV